MPDLLTLHRDQPDCGIANCYWHSRQREEAETAHYEAGAEKYRPTPEEDAAFTEEEELAREHRNGDHHDAMVVECPVCEREMVALGFRTVR